MSTFDWGFFLQFPGCQESCTFYHSQLDVNSETVLKPDNFTQSLTYRHWPENDTIQLEWSRPVSASVGSGPDEPLVYVVALQDQLSGFTQEIAQTFYQNATVRRSLLKSSTLVQLTAYSFSGKVAHLEKYCSEFPHGLNTKNDCTENRSPDGTYMDDLVRHHSREEASLNVNYASWRPTLISLQYSMEDSNGVDAHVTWPHIPQMDRVKYNVEWSRVEHDVDVTTTMVTLDNAVTMTVWPNNIYHVYVRVFANESHRASAVVTTSQMLTIDTTSNSSQKLDLQCSRLTYNVTLTLVLVFGITSSAILISMYVRITGLKFA